MYIPLSDYRTGAAVATALVNTSPTVRAIGGEALPAPEALADFLTEHGVRASALADGRAPTDDDLFQVHLLRREVRGVIETETEEQAVAGGTVLAGRAGLAPVLERDSGGDWQWYVPTAPDAPLDRELAALIGVGLLGAVLALGHERFRPCAAPDCRGVFVDTSRAGRRRYCMPDQCGNRINVANHRARRAGSVTR
ncbi:CGNR zinc finger domain-containing protein [Spirillospora sp. NPDC029432]|uniref:CGNR zinc finger domain-containing protein n=1 Tax=Spirillospora sp. NPDC029432 TaxID=3154599 RepID=UPI00345268E7